MPRKINRGYQPPDSDLLKIAETPELATGGGQHIDTTYLVRVATRVETVLGEHLYSKYPSSRNKPKSEKPFIDLATQQAHVVQIRLPMCMRVFWKDEERSRRIKTQISLIGAGDTLIELDDLRRGAGNLEEINRYATLTLDCASLTTVKINPTGGAGLFPGDINSRPLIAGDIAYWFGPSGLRSQVNIWDPPKFSTGARFAGQFPESPWGVWFAAGEELSPVQAPVFTWEPMSKYLGDAITDDYDYSKVPEKIVDLFNPEGKLTRVYTDSYSAGRNYTFIDRPLKIYQRGKKKVHTVSEFDVEAKALVKALMDNDCGINHIIA